MTLFENASAAVAPRHLSLVRLSALIAQSVSALGRVVVEGEVHRPQEGRTRRVWFTLRDRAAQVQVSVPPARRARARVVAGERVSVTGRLEWVSDWGQLQLVAEEVTPVGEGAIAAAITEARRRLAAEGLLTRPRKPIPILPAAIGVVCGHEAAVRADIESVVAARFPGYPVLFWQTTVSGPGAVDNIVAGLAELDRRPELDVIVLARGGGDAAQLLPFSDEEVCRAVCASSTPVVSAIGHEADHPLVDEVADLRCGTPSLAAAAVVPDRAVLDARLGSLLASCARALRDRMDWTAAWLERQDPAAAAVAGLITATRLLDNAAARLALVHPRQVLAVADRRLAGAARQAEALSPARVLERGYAVVRTEAGVVVRDPADVGGGDELDVEVARGHIGVVVS